MIYKVEFEENETNYFSGNNIYIYSFLSIFMEVNASILPKLKVVHSYIGKILKTFINFGMSYACYINR